MALPEPLDLGFVVRNSGPCFAGVFWGLVRLCLFSVLFGLGVASCLSVGFFRTPGLGRCFGWKLGDQGTVGLRVLKPFQESTATFLHDIRGSLGSC